MVRRDRRPVAAEGLPVPVAARFLGSLFWQVVRYRKRSAPSLLALLANPLLPPSAWIETGFNMASHFTGRGAGAPAPAPRAASGMRRMSSGGAAGAVGLGVGALLMHAAGGAGFGALPAYVPRPTPPTQPGQWTRGGGGDGWWQPPPNPTPAQQPTPTNSPAAVRRKGRGKRGKQRVYSVTQLRTALLRVADNVVLQGQVHRLLLVCQHMVSKRSDRTTLYKELAKALPLSGRFAADPAAYPCTPSAYSVGSLTSHVCSGWCS